MAAYPYQPQYATSGLYNNAYNAMQQVPQYQNTYTPQITQAPQQPVDNLIRVTGLDGAKAYQLPANSSIALFDANDDVMYIKTTDGAGFPSIRAFRFSPIEAVQPEPVVTDYVQRSEFDALAEQVRRLADAQQPISQPEPTNGRATRKQSTQCD